MPLFIWNSSYSVNVKRFDADHQQLFNIINELHEGMKAGHGKDVMHDVLAKLLHYTERHFTAEEAVMKDLGYMQLPAHIEQHRKFTDKIKEVADQYKAGAAGLSVDMLDFLTKWLSQHIMAIDKQYSEFMNAKGVA
ncbi:MAG: bacteriohemerythrin [Candidatus Korobacteraceae bacterium]|jgi:hemerythrin-like metal-binding protein